MILVGQVSLQFFKLTIQYYFWRLIELLARSISILILIPVAIYSVTMIVFLVTLDETLNRAHVPCDLLQRYEQSQFVRVGHRCASRGHRTVIQFCRTRSLRARVVMRGIASYAKSPHIFVDTYTIQTRSDFFSRLPREIRKEIYRWHLFADAQGIRIEVARRAGESRLSSILHGTPFSFGNTRPEVCVKCLGQDHNRHCDAFNRVVLPGSSHGRGKLALAKTCKLAYIEMIDLLYSEFPIPIEWSI